MKSDNAIEIGVLFKGVAPTTMEWEGEQAVMPFRTPVLLDPEMKRMPIHLLVSSRVDQSRWPDPAHLALANLDLENHKRVEWFLRTYGLSARFFKNWTREKAFIDIGTLRDLQAGLRRDWDLLGKIRAEVQSKLNLVSALPPGMEVKTQRGRLWIVTKDLWGVIDIGWRLDLARGKIGLCKLSDCKRLRYFVKPRPDAEFCSAHCRSVFYMRERRKDAEKREIDNARRRKGKRRKRRRRK